MLRVKPVFLALAAITLGIGVLVGATAVRARADGTLCAYATAPVAGGTYIVQNDEWNSSATECVTPGSGAGFTVTSSQIANSTDGDPGGYPSIYMGCHYGNCTAGGLGSHPLPLSDIKPGLVTSSWYTTQPPGDSAYDVAYDIWINKTPATSGAPDGTEVMVWLNHSDAIQPAGSMVGTTSISGHHYDVWYGAGTGAADIVTYEMTTGRTSVANLDIGAVISNARKLGYTDPSWYLISVEAGFEIWQGGVGLATTSFSVDLSPIKPGPRASSTTSTRAVSGSRLR